MEALSRLLNRAVDGNYLSGSKIADRDGVTGPDPDTPPRFPGWSRLVEFHCTISRECTKGPHLKEK